MECGHRVPQASCPVHCLLGPSCRIWVPVIETARLQVQTEASPRPRVEQGWLITQAGWLRGWALGRKASVSLSSSGSRARSLASLCPGCGVHSSSILGVTWDLRGRVRHQARHRAQSWSPGELCNTAIDHQLQSLELSPTSGSCFKSSLGWKL